ncbi:MAG: hypothetical protein WC332_08325 [Clostridia bacterium]|jgi:Flp pilus assembly protein TadB
MRYEFIRRALVIGFIYGVCAYLLYLSLIVSILTGVIIAAICLCDKKYMKQVISRRNRESFERFLEILVSYTAIPSNFMHAFSQSLTEFMRVYPKDELTGISDRIYSKTTANFQTEQILESFSQNLDIEEAYLFCDSIVICEKKGADFNRTIKESIAFIKEKRSIEQEIEVITEEKKTERLIVSLCPFLILAVFNAMGTGYLDILYKGILGRGIMTIAGILFFLCSFLAKKILEVKV